MTEHIPPTSPAHDVAARVAQGRKTFHASTSRPEDLAGLSELVRRGLVAVEVNVVMTDPEGIEKALTPLPPRPLPCPDPEWELHLEPSKELPRMFGKGIKELGGRYSACRGHASKRVVHIPATKRGERLASTLLDQFGRGKATVISRGVLVTDGKAPSWATVQYWIKQDGATFETVRKAIVDSMKRALELDMATTYHLQPAE